MIVELRYAGVNGEIFNARASQGCSSEAGVIGSEVIRKQQDRSDNNETRVLPAVCKLAAEGVGKGGCSSAVAVFSSGRLRS